MKKSIIYLAVSTALAFAGCDYLDDMPYDWAQPDDIFTNEQNYLKPVNEVYAYIPGKFNHIGSAFLDAATDDGISTLIDSDIHKLSRGYITSSNPVKECWYNSYKGIRQAIFARKHLREADLVLQNKTEEDIQAFKDTYCAETECLQALFEFNLLRHYGGFPIVDRIYEVDEPELQTKERDSFKDCVNHIVQLCESAAAVLKVDPEGGNGSYGRMTKGMALAIKAKTLIYAASPLYNRADNNNPLLGYTDGSDVAERWKLAAKACADVINLNTDGTIAPGGNKKYNLIALNATKTYDKIFIHANPNPEYVLFYTAAKDNNLENRHYPPTISKDQGGGTVPSQELIDAFTMEDGSDYTDASDGEDMYTHRDPRLKAIIGYDGSSYGKNKIYTRISSNTTMDGLNQVKNRSTNTGYYLAKFLDKTLNFGQANVGTVFHLFPMIRLSDILLSYAEAMHHAYGMNADPEGYGLTAVEALRKVRSRAGFGTDDKFFNGMTDANFMAKVKQERRVELCFEEHRYFDLRRWMDGAQLQNPIIGMRVEENSTGLHYTRFTVDETRNFKDHMYYHPIPLKVIKESPSIRQNPGW